MKRSNKESKNTTNEGLAASKYFSNVLINNKSNEEEIMSCVLEQHITLSKLRPRSCKVESHETLASDKLLKKIQKKNLSSKSKITDVHKPAENKRYPLRNRNPSGNLQSGSSSEMRKFKSVNSKSVSPNVEVMLEQHTALSRLRPRPIKIDSHETLRSIEIHKKSKKNISISSEISDVHKSFEQVEFPLINIKTSGNFMSDKPPISYKSDELSVKSNSCEPSFKSMSGETVAEDGIENSSLESNPADSASKSNPADSAAKSNPADSAAKSNPADSAAKSNCVDSAAKSKSVKHQPLKLPQMFQSEEYQLDKGVAGEPVFVNKKCLETEFNSEQQADDIIGKFISSRKHYLTIMYNDFVEADLFNSAVDKRLHLHDVFKILGETRGDVNDWHLFHEYWNRFKSQFSVITEKFNKYFSRNARSNFFYENEQNSGIKVDNTEHVHNPKTGGKNYGAYLPITKLLFDRIRFPVIKIKRHYVYRIGTEDLFDLVHFPKTKNELDDFLNTMIAVYNIVESILSICTTYFDGILRNVSSEDHMFPSYILNLRSYLSSFHEKLKIEIYIFKLFDKKWKINDNNYFCKFTKC